MRSDSATAAPLPTAPRLAFIYSTRYTLWPGMARFLYAPDGPLRDTLESCETEILRHMGWSLKRELASHTDMSALLAAEHVLEPAVTAVQIALTEAWRERGVEPAATAGYSGGEFAAGYARGALSFSEAIDLACRVGRLFGECPYPGHIVRVDLSVEKIEALQQDGPAPFHVAADPRSDVTVIACTAAGLDPVVRFLTARGAPCHVEPISLPVHSPFMSGWEAEARKPFRRDGQRPQSGIAGYSATDGLKIRDSSTDSGFLWRSVGQRVYLSRMIRSMLADGYNVFMEIGGRAVLTTAIKEAAAVLGKQVLTLTTMRGSEALLPVMDEAQATLARLGLVR